MSEDSTDALSELHELYDQSYGPFDSYSTTEVVEVAPGMSRVFMRPNRAALDPLLVKIGVSPMYKVTAICALIIDAAFEKMFTVARGLSKTNGKCDVYIEANPEEDERGKLPKGMCILNLDDPGLKSYVQEKAFMAETEQQVAWFFQNNYSIGCTTKSVLVNAYLYPTWIPDHILRDEHGDIRSDYCPILEKARVELNGK